MQRWAGGVLLVLALVLRLAVGLGLEARGAHELPDSDLYKAYGETILAGQPYRVGDATAKRAPGYPGFIAAVWAVRGRASDTVVLVVQAFVATAGLALVVAIVHQLRILYGVGTIPAGVGLAALTLAALEPYGLVLSGMLLAEAVGTTLLLLTAWSGLRATTAQRPVGRTAWAAVTGLVAGVAILVRPSTLLLGPVALLLWACWARPWSRAGQLLVPCLVAALLTLLPWWWRNYELYGAFVPTTTNVGESLYDGWNPDATGASDMRFEREPRVARLDELSRDRHWRDAALAWAAENPRRVLELAGLKLLRFWSPWPNEARFRSPLVVVGTAALTVPTLLLAGVGAWRWRQHAGLLVIGLLPIVYFCCLHMVFVSSVRYRAPAMPFVCLLAGMGAMLLWRGVGQTRREEPA